jgi:zinc protease
VNRGTSRVGVAALLVLVACASAPPTWKQPPPPVREGPVVDASRLHRSRLENGLELVVLEDRRFPRAGFALTVRRGAGVVPPKEAGLAVFTAELLERGAGSRDALALAEAVDTLGASFSASAGWDSSSVSLSGLSRDTASLIGILSDVVLRPRFEAGEAARARSELLAALERAKDQPRSMAGRAFAALLYPGHRYGLPLEGAPETLEELGSDDVRAFHARVFTPGNAIFSAWGDVDAADIRARVEVAFGGWESVQPPEPGPPPERPAPSERRVVVVDFPDRGQAQILIGHDGIAYHDPERLAAILLNADLGASGFISRLMTRVRAEAGLTYGIYSYFSLRRQAGPFAVSTSTRVPEVRRVIDLVLQTVEEARAEPPSGEAFRRMQTLLAGRFALGLETAGAIAGSLVDLDVQGLPPDSLDTYRTRVAATTENQVASAARRLLHPRRAAIVVVGPADAIRPQLEGLGPVEIIEP